MLLYTEITNINCKFMFQSLNMAVKKFYIYTHAIDLLFSKLISQIGSNLVLFSFANFLQKEAIHRKLKREVIYSPKYRQKFSSLINGKNTNNCWHFNIWKQILVCAGLSMKKLNKLGAWSETSM